MKVINVVAVLFLSVGVANAASADEIIQLCQAGIAEDLVVAAAKKQPVGDITTSQMLAVKAACGENVLRALMQPVQQAGAVSVPVATQAKSAGEEVRPNSSMIASATSRTKSVVGVATSIFKRGDAKNKEIEHTDGQRLFITAKAAEIGGDEFADKSLTDSVNDLKGSAKKFSVVETEGEADLKLVLLGRQYEQVRPTIMRHKTQRTEGILNCALYRREGAEWKPVVKLRSQSLYWKDAASKMIKEVSKSLE